MNLPKSLSDAYCHIGNPRFGTAEDALAVLDQWNIGHVVFVLGPLVPDFATLFDALGNYPDRVRGIGITFGDSVSRMDESIEIQIRGGASGIRMWAGDIIKCKSGAAIIGEIGGWIYAVGPLHSDESANALLDWLEKYPRGRVAAPHFLAPAKLCDLAGTSAPKKDLLNHPRFFMIFSRQGEVGSTCPYPHNDLRQWVEDALEYAGWDRVMWASEYPVLYWRNETMDMGLQWLTKLGIRASQEQSDNFFSANCKRLFFSSALPKPQPVQIPSWIKEQFDLCRTVSLFPKQPLEIDMETYQALHHRYVSAMHQSPTMTFGQFVSGYLQEAIANVSPTRL